MSDGVVIGQGEGPASPAARRVVWHRKFGFGLAAPVTDQSDADDGWQVPIDFGPHWGQRSIALRDGLLRSAPSAEDAQVLAHPVGVGPGFSPAPDPVADAFAAWSVGAAPPSAGDLDKAVASWEESVRWIEKGWDDIDEYWHDLLYRKSLERKMAHAAMAKRLDATSLSAVLTLDYRYWRRTAASSLCVFHTSPLYQSSGTLVKLLRSWYDHDRFWYYYRWPAEVAAYYAGYDVFSWQRQKWGLDFLHMNDLQLRDRVLEMNAEMERHRAQHAIKQNAKFDGDGS